jgi:hypothetical protein
LTTERTEHTEHTETEGNWHSRFDRYTRSESPPFSRFRGFRAFHGQSRRAQGAHELSVQAILAAVIVAALVVSARAADDGVKARLDPVTRYFHITYRVPAGAPDRVAVRCSWAPVGSGNWRVARVTPKLGETGLRLATDADWSAWQDEGRVVEMRAAGLDRTVIFNPYPEAENAGRVDADFRVRIETEGGALLVERTTRLQADNTDVVTIEDWTKVIQHGVVVKDAEPKEGQWAFLTNLPATDRVSRNDALYGRGTKHALPQITYPLDLHGTYAIFVRTNPTAGGIRMRLTRDEFGDQPISRRPGEESLWRWARMDRQHLVLGQGHAYTGWTTAHMDYVRFVPLKPEQVRALDAQFGAKADRIVGAYFEPYSWAFNENVQTTLQHREPLAAFAEA